ncbi:hypothetical protein GCM10010129_16690 [Streptomyces fumigatiscleroticus]|nr:hypothetical protein GCM10010129_16690 [Streptomyces fumigatiscleroticus]
MRLGSRGTVTVQNAHGYGGANAAIGTPKWGKQLVTHSRRLHEGPDNLSGKRQVAGFLMGASQESQSFWHIKAP